MSLTLRRFLFCFLLFAKINTIQAQQPLGLVVGDLNTPYSVNMNPANVASQFSNRAYVNWWGSSLDIQSNFTGASGWKRNPGSIKMDQSWLPKTEDQNWSMNYLNETFGPSLFAMPDKNVGFGLGVKGVSGFNFSGVSPTLGKALQSGRPFWEQQFGSVSGIVIRKGCFDSITSRTIEEQKFRNQHLTRTVAHSSDSNKRFKNPFGQV